MNRTDGKYSALHVAVKYFKPENVKLLVEHGASKSVCVFLQTMNELLLVQICLREMPLGFAPSTIALEPPVIVTSFPL